MKPRLTTLLMTLGLVLMSATGIAAQAPASQNAISTQAALGTNFIYQGFLNNNGQPANGPFDFEFKIYDTLSGGTQVGATSTAANQAVANGLFNVMIDAGAGVFNGSARFLQISVRPAGSGAFVALSPRIELAAVPSAQYSSSTGGVQGRPVSAAAPAPNQVLQWDGSQWAPANVAVAAPLNLSGSVAFPNGIITASNSGNGRGIRGIGSEGVAGESPATDGTGVYGVANIGTNAYGVWGDSAGGFGVVGTEGNGSGFGSSIPVGVMGNADDGDGVFGLSKAKYGVEGYSDTSFGVFGSTGNNGSYAGYFQGRVRATGGVVTGAAPLISEMDHPLDPANKYLRHSAVESPDVKNIYDGVVTLDANGAAMVDLPAYFQALNQDFRYQLTCIGGFAPIYIDKEIENNRFSIAGGKPNMKVSWQVTGIRHDPGAEQNRPLVEENKPAAERGTYLQPSAYGQPETLGVDYARQGHTTVQQTKLPKGR